VRRRRGVGQGPTLALLDMHDVRDARPAWLWSAF